MPSLDPPTQKKIRKPPTTAPYTRPPIDKDIKLEQLSHSTPSTNNVLDTWQPKPYLLPP